MCFLSVQEMKKACFISFITFCFSECVKHVIVYIGFKSFSGCPTQMADGRGIEAFQDSQPCNRVSFPTPFFQVIGSCRHVPFTERRLRERLVVWHQLQCCCTCLNVLRYGNSFFRRRRETILFPGEATRSTPI